MTIEHAKLDAIRKRPNYGFMGRPKVLLVICNSPMYVVRFTNTDEFHYSRSLNRYNVGSFHLVFINMT
jgi:hypothetical protein